MSVFAQKVQQGLALSNHRLLEYNSALNRILIIGQRDGTYKEIAAKELLKQAST